MNAFFCGLLIGAGCGMMAMLALAMCISASRADKNLEQPAKGENENQA